MITVALGVGFGLSYFALVDGRLFGAYTWGSWVAWPEVGSPTPAPYTKAYVARNGALQLGRGEGIQFIATRDNEGQSLLRNCAYRLAGETPVATFWTLRAETSAGVNIAAAGSPLSVNSNRLSRLNNGIAVIHVSKQLAPENWLEITGEGKFELVLTFYDASVFAGFGSSVVALPVIINEGCT